MILSNINRFRYPVLYEESFNTVLLQEAIRYNGLLNVVKTTLMDLLKALKGLVVMSGQLETLFTSLYNNRIPKIWQDKGYPSLKPLGTTPYFLTLSYLTKRKLLRYLHKTGSWFLDLKDRIAFLKSWEEYGIPAAFWISGFYFPQAFLTGTLQNFARKHIVSIDTINFSFKVLSINKFPQSRIFLEGEKHECLRASSHVQKYVLQFWNSRDKSKQIILATFNITGITNKANAQAKRWLCCLWFISRGMSMGRELLR